MSNVNKDIAEKEHWDAVYGLNSLHINNKGWVPATYEALCLEHMLSFEIEKYQPKSILEVGCGSSTWLPYLSKKYNVEVAGIDYSEIGCVMAKSQLDSEGIEAEIHCVDVYNADVNKIGEYDLVYSLGLVEHFENTEDIIKQLLKFVKPGGRLLTEVPNLNSLHGVLSWAYQPKQLDKHVVLKYKDLKHACENNNCTNVDGDYLGVLSLDIVAWGINQRYPKLDQVILPIIFFIKKIINYFFRRNLIFKGNKLFSPFVYVVCSKP